MTPTPTLGLRRLAVTLGSVAALLASSLGTAAPPAHAAPSDQARAAACARSLPAGTSLVEVPFAGVTTRVRVNVPDAPSRKALPLVLDLHGSSANGTVQAGISGLGAIADREQFIVAQPTAAIPLPTTDPLPDGNWAWNVPGVPTTAGAFPPAGARDDVAYLSAVVDQLDARACVDERRIYATGFSGGGRMASALACARPDLIAAIAPVAGLRAGRPDPTDTTTVDAASCPPDAPVAVLTFHGDADFVNPFAGSADLRWGYSVNLALATWADLDDCRARPSTMQVSEHVTRISYAGCARRAAVVGYIVEGGGHTWPGTAVDLSPLGVTTQEIDASELMWEFFAAHQRRG
ncbi:alpha/beta hydrolase family esterase [Propioniciclava soli]|uniref:alpha/beta hydrolase family esterase n=1 Tax=Propioniciclava soli TaxID=2775081 RepID=UPI001E4ED9FF|nr:PHB depolymerase family esterase [Propioniciclava soli]